MQSCKKFCLITLCIGGLITLVALAWAIAIGIGLLTAVATNSWDDGVLCSNKLSPARFLFGCALEGIITLLTGTAILGLFMLLFWVLRWFIRQIKSNCNISTNEENDIYV